MLDESECNNEINSNCFTNENNNSQTDVIILNQLPSEIENIEIQTIISNPNDTESLLNSNDIKECKIEEKQSNNTIFISTSIIVDNLKGKKDFFSEEICKKLIKIKYDEKKLFEKYLSLIKKENDDFLLKNITVNLEVLKKNIRVLVKRKYYIFSIQKNEFILQYYDIVAKIQKKKQQNYRLIQKEIDLEFLPFFNKFINWKVKDFFEIIDNFDLNKMKNFVIELKNINFKSLTINGEFEKINEFTLYFIQNENEFFIKLLEKLINLLNQN